MADDFDPKAFLAETEPAKEAPFDPKEFLGEEKPLAWSEVPGQAMSNVVPSAVEAGKALYQTVRHPIQTGENLAGVAAGFGQKAGLLPNTGAESQNYEPYANAMIDYFKKSYGSVDALKHKMAHDPVGFVSDASGVFGGGELALARMPGIIGKVGEVSGAVSRATNPISAAGAILPKAGKLAGVMGDTAAENAELAKEGVLRTPGQRLGGMFKTTEDAVSGWPILGTFIKNGRTASVESFNEAVANQALESIGEKATAKAGHALVQEVEEKLGDAYDKLLPQLSFNADNDFIKDLNSIRNDVRNTTTGERAAQYDRIVQSRLPAMYGPNKQTASFGAGLTGEEYKAAESQLKTIANQYRGSLDGDQRALASALDRTVKAMKSGLERSNPTMGPELANINKGWAMYDRIRAAAARRATSGGVFTPNDLLAAAKAGDKSIGHGSWAKGEALMQKFAEVGQKVLPSTLPTSGTTERGMTAMALLEGAHFVDPATLAVSAAAAGPYTKLGMKATDIAARNKLFSRVPAGALPAGRASEMATGQYNPPSITVPRRAEERKSGGAVKSTFDPSSIGARKAKNHQWFIPDPNRPGRYLQVLPKQLGHARRLRPSAG